MLSHPTRVVVGSKNPVKLHAVSSAFSQVFADDSIEYEGVNIDQVAPNQPITERETIRGAISVIHQCQKYHDADYYVSIVGGVENFDYGPATFAYVAIADNHRQSVGRSANLPLPPAVYEDILQGKELASVMDGLFGTRNLKQHGGAIDLLTNGLESRKSMYTQTLILSMAPFLHGQLYDC